MIFISWVFIHPRMRQGVILRGMAFLKWKTLQDLIKMVQFWIFLVFSKSLTINAFGRYLQKFFMCKP